MLSKEEGQRRAQAAGVRLPELRGDADFIRDFMACPMRRSQAGPRWQAEAEGLTLIKADTKTGYCNVSHKPGQPKPYQAQVTRGGKVVTLGCFATAEEAALCIARSPEGRAAAAKRAAAAPPLTSEEAEEVEVLEAEEVEEEVENVPMVEVVAAMEPEVIDDEGGRSTGRPKRRRNA